MGNRSRTASTNPSAYPLAHMARAPGFTFTVTSAISWHRSLVRLRDEVVRDPGAHAAADADRNGAGEPNNENVGFHHTRLRPGSSDQLHDPPLWAQIGSLTVGRRTELQPGSGSPSL